MCVLCVGTGGERNLLVAGVEVGIEPSEESVDIVLPRGLELKGRFKVEVLDLDSLEIDVLDHVGLGDDGFQLDAVNKGFPQDDGKHGAVVETVNIVPD